VLKPDKRVLYAELAVVDHSPSVERTLVEHDRLAAGSIALVASAEGIVVVAAAARSSPHAVAVDNQHSLVGSARPFLRAGNSMAAAVAAERMAARMGAGAGSLEVERSATTRTRVLEAGDRLVQT
jgi:hypothetical protein